jgi:5-(carboxyamino)imidazole ribonucleotide synthase
MVVGGLKNDTKELPPEPFILCPLFFSQDSGGLSGECPQKQASIFAAENNHRMATEFYDKSFRIGVLGGGQLGRMLIQEAVDIDAKISVLDPAPDAPCARVAHEFRQGDLNDFETVVGFGADKDVITIEIENVNADALAELEQRGKAVFPSSRVLRTIQDKGFQKEFYRQNDIPTTDFVLVRDKAELLESGFGFPMVQKLRTGGYDGRGVSILRSPDDIDRAFDAPSVLERLADIRMELAVIVARNARGESEAFPPVEMVFDPEANLVDLLAAPARISDSLYNEATMLAVRVAESLDAVGLLAVEMFLTNDGRLLVNEIAPRPHNSGHHTIEANITSQYAQHLRSILNLPLGSTETLRPAAMVNLLGEKGHSGPVRYEGLREAMALPGVFVHLYGKTETKPFRKMGHVTIAADTLDEALDTAQRVKNLIRVISQ